MDPKTLVDRKTVLKEVEKISNGVNDVLTLNKT